MFRSAAITDGQISLPNMSADFALKDLLGPFLLDANAWPSPLARRLDANGVGERPMPDDKPGQSARSPLVGVVRVLVSPSSKRVRCTSPVNLKVRPSDAP